MDVQKLPGLETGRVETGPVQFGEDWPGLFLRGDYAMYVAMNLEHLKNVIEEKLSPEIKQELFMPLMVIEDLYSTIVEDVILKPGGPKNE